MRWPTLLFVIILAAFSIGSGSFSCSTGDDDDDNRPHNSSN